MTNKRITNLVRRHLREKARASAHYSAADAALTKARELGLDVGEPIEVEIPRADGSIEKTAFALTNNFEGESAFRNTRIPKFELKKVPKFKRTAPAEAQPAATAEAGV